MCLHEIERDRFRERRRRLPFSPFAPGLVSWLAQKALLATGALPALTQGAAAFESMTIVDFPLLYAGLIIEAFAMIISYGCLLQQQDDGLV